MPDLSRHSTIAQDVVEFLDANWSQKPGNVQIVRARSFEAATKTIAETEDAFICVIVPDVEAATESRGSDRDTVPVFACVIASVPALEETLLDAWDLRSEQVADVLRDRRLKLLALGNGIVATRQGTVSIPTTADADWLYGSEIFVSVIEMAYSFSVPVGEVS